MKTFDSVLSPGRLAAVLALFFVLAQLFFGYGNYRAGSAPAELLGSAAILSLPLAMLCLMLGVLVLAERQKRTRGAFSRRLAAWVYYTPRLAGILVAFFVSLFALDVFTGEESFWRELAGFFVHALPAILLLGAALLAWRRPQAGFWMFLGAALLFLRFLSPGNFVLFNLPMACVALLFWMNWKWQALLRPPE